MSSSCVQFGAITKTYVVSVPTVVVPSFMRRDDNWIALHHNRVAVGVLVFAGAVVRCRTAPGCPAITVHVRFLNNNRSTEELMIVDKTFSSHTVQHDSVLFVDYTLDADVIAVEINVEGEVCDLPIYRSMSSVKEFKEMYAESSCPYALLELNTTRILVPPVDKSTVLALDLMALDTFYTQIVNQFNYMAGFRKDFDYKYKVHFFCKADINGPGAAYYGKHWTANSASSLNAYLQVRSTNWLVFHEFGHAYDMVFISSTGLMEVWNNVYGDRMQFSLMNAVERQTFASVYENNNRERVETNLMQLIETYVPYQQWSFFQKLAFFVFIMNSGYGMDMWREINRQMRMMRIVEDEPVYPNIMLWLLESCPADLGAYFELCNIPLPQYTASIGYLTAPVFPYLANIAQSKPALYPIKYLIENFDLDTNNYALKLYIESNLDLVRPQQLWCAHLPSITLVIRCIINDVKQIEGELFGVYDGELLVYEAPVNSMGEYTVPSLTPGVYTMRPPRGKDRRYTLTFDDFDNPGEYIIVTTSTPSVDVRELMYKELTPHYAKDVGHAFGLNEVHALTFIVNYSTQEIEVHIINPVINSFFGHQLYFRIEISEPKAEFVIQGNGENIDQDVYYYKFIPGVTTMNLRHLQASLNRLLFLHNAYTLSPVMFRLLENNVEAVTSNIIVPSRLHRIKDDLEYYAAWLDKHPIMLNVENEVRDKIFVLIQSVDNQEEYEMLTLMFNKYYPKYYKDLDLYRIDLKGYDNILRFRLKCMLAEGRGKFITYNAPNGPNFDLSTNLYYVFVSIIDDEGNTINEFKFNSDESLTYKITDVVLKQGYIIAVSHLEPSRIEIYKNNEQLNVTFVDRLYLLEVNGLELVLK